MPFAEIKFSKLRENDVPKSRTYSRYTGDALILLGRLIKLGRQKRHWSADELAERVGISRPTLRKIESGYPNCSIGLVFEAAYLVGIPLFDSDAKTIAGHLARTADMLTLLPQSIRTGDRDVDDDF